MHIIIQNLYTLYERVSGNKIMTKVDNGDRNLTEDEETGLEMIGWYGGDKPEDPDRNKVVIKPGTKAWGRYGNSTRYLGPSTTRE